MPISRIKLRNFQKHESFVLDLSPTVTCLTGRTNVGKTAILRALRWVAFNRPQGQRFRRHGSDKTAATVIADGHTIKRIKGDQDNCYVVDGVKLKAMGGSVPDVVNNILKIGETSWQKQGDPAFLFSRSPGEVARYLNQIISLEDIDTALSKLNSRLREAKTRIDVTRDRKKLALEEYKALKPIELQDKALRDIEGIVAKRGKIVGKADLLRSLTETCQSTARRLKIALRAVSAPALTVTAVEAAATAEKQCAGLRDAVGEIRRLDRRIVDNKAELLRLEKEFERTFGTVCPLCGQEVHDGIQTKRPKDHEGNAR